MDINNLNCNLAMNIVEEARRRHDTWATASDALRCSMTAGVIFGAMLSTQPLIHVI